MYTVKASEPIIIKFGNLLGQLNDNQEYCHRIINLSRSSKIINLMARVKTDVKWEIDTVGAREAGGFNN